MLGDTFVPSHVKTVSSQIINASQHHMDFNDLSIKVGKVIAAYAATDASNRNKKYIEYDVEVLHSVKNGGLTKIVYSRCIITSLFGGIADYLHWTPRLNISKTTGDSSIDLGSQVLIACLNGQTRYAYIIGGIPNTNADIQEEFTDNHHFKAEFNGLAVRIGDTGDFSILHRGATNADGTVKSTSGNGAYFSLTSDGNATLAYSDGQTAASLTLTQSPDQAILKGGTITLNTSGEAVILANSGVKINGASEAFVNGTTYRSQQETLNSSYISDLGALGVQIGLAGAALTTAGPLMLIPIVGAMIAGPFVLAAGTALTTAAPAIEDMTAATEAFEALAGKYLSIQNFHDDSDTSPLKVDAIPDPVQTTINDDGTTSTVSD